MFDNHADVRWAVCFSVSLDSCRTRKTSGALVLRAISTAVLLMVFASYCTEREFDNGDPNQNDTESAFGLGLYARTGIEFRIHEKGMLGLGARANWSSVDFSDVGGSSDLTGLGLYASYTAGF